MARAADQGVSAGNQRLTATTASALIVLLLVEGVTVVFLRQLLAVHLFVGALLIPPVLLKLSSTGYRFARYYTGSSAYRAKGAPPLVLRAIAPMVVISSVVLLASGIWLLVAGPSSKNAVLPIHKVSFIVWVAFTGVHVLGHVLELPGSIRAEVVGHADVAGRSLRWLVLALALCGGTALGFWALGYAGPWARTF